jgi:hypothetical protein
MDALASGVVDFFLLNPSTIWGHALNKDNIAFHSAGREVEIHVKIFSSKTDQKGRATTLVLKSQADFLILYVYMHTQENLGFK